MIRKIFEGHLEDHFGVNKAVPLHQNVLQSGKKIDRFYLKTGHLKMSDVLKLRHDEKKVVKMVGSYVVEESGMAEYHHEYYEVEVPTSGSMNRFFSTLRDKLTGVSQHELFVSYATHQTGIRCFSV